MRPLISICMIVKNEEAVLRQSLASFHEFVSEIVIVDTGSTDDTKKIASEFTDKVYDFEWVGNFSEARNFAAKYATGKWIVVVDADECLEKENYLAVESFLKRLTQKEEIFTGEIISFTGEKGSVTVTNKMPRIYRNNGDIAYRGAIHEQLFNSRTGNTAISDSPLKIYHYGYMSEVVDRQDKVARNLEILKKEMKEEESSGFAEFNLGQELYREHKFEEALQAFSRAFQKRTSNRLVWAKISALNIAKILEAKKEYADALAILEEARIIWPDTPEFFLKKADIKRALHQLPDAKKIYHYLIEQTAVIFQPIAYYEATSFLPHKALGDIYQVEKDYVKAIKHYSLAYQQNSSDYEVKYQMIQLLSKFHSPSEVYDFISRHGFIENEEDGTKILSFTTQLGLGNLSAIILNSMPDLNIVLQEIMQVKIQTIQNIFPVISKQAILAGIRTNLIDVADLCIWHFENGTLPIEQIMKNSNAGELYQFLYENGPAVEEELYLFVMERGIALGKGEFIDQLLVLRSHYEDSINSRIADLFFQYDYKDIALDLYNTVDASAVTKEGHLNLIQYLVEENITEEALSIVERGLDNFATDFRFHEWAILLDETNREMRISEAIDEFPDSTYLAELQGNLIDLESVNK